MTQQILIILTICIVVQLAMLSVFLISSRKGRRISNLLLAFFFFLLIINLADGIIAYAGLYTRYPYLAHLEDGFVFLFGPSLYLYTQSLLYRDFRIQRKHLVHIVPFVVLTLAYQLYYHLQPESDQLKIQRSIVDRSLPAAFYIFVLIIYAHVCAYVFLSYRHIIFYRRRIRDTFSSLDKINLDWLSFMLGTFAFLLLLSFIYTFVPAVGWKKYFDPLFISAFVFIFFFAIAMVWKGLRQPEIFSGIEHPPEQREPKYAVSITDEERTAMQRIRIRLMDQERIFLDPDLTLDRMASMTPFSPKRLSQLINDTFGQTFFDFVNSYRIAEAARMLKDSTRSRQTVLEVMYACGFSSKSSFNTVFRQKTGMTPTEYRKAPAAGSV